ncbi:MAG: dihydrofolate reductase family protein [Kineosporiaceae bacterium]
MSELRLLLPGPAVVGDLSGNRADALQALADLYAYPDPVPAPGWVRACMVATVDGSSGDPTGSSAAISGPADQTLFGVLRALADVVLVGGGTARTEGYRPLPARAAFSERRAAAGQAPAAAVAVVTRSGNLDGLSGLFAPGVGSLVVTSRQAPLDRLRAVAGTDRVIVAGDEDVDPVLAMAGLAGRGLRRVLLEGGPTLLGAVAAAARLDELCLTWSPLLVAGNGARIAHGPPAWLRLRLASLVAHEDTLFGRWMVTESEHRPAV